VAAFRFRTLAEAPDLLALAAAAPERYPYLLESAAPGPLGRYSLLLRTSGKVVGAAGKGQGAGASFFDALDHAYLSERVTDDPRDEGAFLPFAGGWFVYLGYEAAGAIEPVLALPAATDGLPVAFAARCPGAVLLRHTPGGRAQAWMVAETQELLEQMAAEVAVPPRRSDASFPDLEEISAEPAARFEAAVGRIHEYLRAGDVFQVNLSRGWSGRFAAPPSADELYRRLRRANPAPFAGLMRHRDAVLLSSSPERLVETRGRRVQTRPIAGTHPRGASPERDRALIARMVAHPKERAEHIMLIDLERNDLGRVCEAGTVEVNELMAVESYAHVHHLVSNVRGRLRPDMTPVDAIRAVFPGGTITGCPKVRCMQIIAALEGRGRGFYTGSMGYLDRRGRMDLNILIRSMLVRGQGLTFRTGAGIVADSQARREVEETEHKARGLLAALGADAEAAPTP